MLNIIIIAAIAAIGLWYFFVRPLSFWTRIGVKQSKPWIFVGDAWRSIFAKMSFGDFVQAIYNMHPGERYSGFYSFSKPILILRDPELIKQFTVKDFENFTDHSPFVDPDADPLWNHALLSLKGERWKEMRNTLSPAFTSHKIKSIYILIQETAKNFVNYFLEKEDGIIETNIKDAYSRFTNDVIATTAFGVQVDSLKDQKNVFYEMGKKLTFSGNVTATFLFIGHKTFPKLFKTLGIPFLNREASKYFCDVIDTAINTRETHNIVRPDMLQLMLEARSDNQVDESNESGMHRRAVKISNAEMASQAMLFFFGGFDTVSTAMSFGSYELALNKDVQDRLREEITETQKEGKFTYDQLMQLKYMDMVVSEILRKWPPFPITDRLCTKPYIIEPVHKNEKPVPILVNQEVSIPIYAIQRDPKYFPNPEKFDPERFSDENKNNIVPYTYIPFGIGPRVCIGNRFALLEIKALLFNLLIHYELVPIKKTPIPLVLSSEFSQIPVGGIWLGLKRIKS